MKNKRTPEEANIVVEKRRERRKERKRFQKKIDRSKRSK
jgi:hypothetical protein